MRRGAASALVALVLASALVPAAGEPHAALVKSSPAARAVLARSPARTELWFSERLEPAYSSLSVVDGADVAVDGKDVVVGPDDPRRLSVSLPALPPGRYTVRFRVLSVDGHLVQSTFPFTIKRPPRP
jgi:hypothetical protein